MKRWHKIALGVGAGLLLVLLLRRPTAASVTASDTLRLTGPLRVLALGDSLTGNPGYCSGLREAIRATGGSVDCKSLEGEGTRAIYDRLQRVGPGHNVLVVLAGVNDLASDRSVAHVEKWLDLIYRRAEAMGMAVVAVELTPWAGHYKGRKLQEETEIINGWIRRHPVPHAVISTYDLGDFTGHLFEGFDRGDGLHMTPDGGRELAMLVIGGI